MTPLAYLKGVSRNEGGFDMAHRLRPPARKDKKVFRRTAVKSKKINIDPKIYRGGIRL